MPRRTLPENSFAAQRPDLAAELDPARNENVDPWSLGVGSHRKVWWRCAAGHSWEAGIKNRTQLGSGCPRCADERRWLVSAQRSLAGRFPALAAELDAERNGDLDPWSLPPATKREVWWRGCAEGHPPWRSRPWRRVQGNGCPYCAGSLPLPERSLAAHPDLVAQLDPDHSEGVRPHEIAARGPTELSWRCSQGHTWRAPVGRRVGGSGCPYCSGLRVTPDRALSAYPELVAELAPGRNPGIDPAAVAAKGDARLWWRCSEGHVWQAQVKSRVKVRTGCPVCAPRGKRGIPLAEQRPDLVDQWVGELNDGAPDEVMAGSDKKAWWRCPANPSHLWRARINNRVRHQLGCPYCGHRRVAPETSLAATRLDIATQWHPELNGNLSPSELLPSSHRSVWWLGECGHAWEAQPSARCGGSGCPFCAAARKSDHYVQDRSRLEPLRRWAAEHGVPPTARAWTAAGARPTAATLCRRFGSWNAALTAAGLAPRPSSRSSRPARTELRSP